MPPKKRTASDYDSDDGFVEKADKKPKTEHSSNKAEDTEEIVGGGLRNEQGEEYWEVSPSHSHMQTYGPSYKRPECACQ